MADLFATGIQIPNLSEGSARTPDYASFIRVFARNDRLYGVRNDGTEVELGGNQQVFLDSVPQNINYPAILFEPTIVDGQTVYVMKVNVI